MEIPEKPVVKIYGNESLSSRVAAFQKKTEEHKQKQKTNPFTHGLSGMERPKWDKSDPRYGRPAEGSKAERRGLAAGSHIGNELQFLCDMINEYGIADEDGTMSITFGELFNIYTVISNKVVGILLRARKHGLVHFEGEMLYQRRDEDVVIRLLKSVKEIREMFGTTNRKFEVGEAHLASSEDH